MKTFRSYDFQEFAGYGLKFGSITALDSSGDIQAVSVSNDVGGPLDLEVGSHFPAYDFCGIVSSLISLTIRSCGISANCRCPKWLREWRV